MQVATTIQFRKAVRKVAKKQGLTIYDSYTNGAPMFGSAPGRTVGFSMPNATPSLAAKIEKKLNKKGLTAKTRCTGNRIIGNHGYIRGTCVLA